MSSSNGITGGRYATKKIILNGLMIALVFLVTYFTKIPGPVGPFNIGDAAIVVTAVILGRKSGFIAGAFGSAIADIAMGYSIFAPVTFFVKGFEGFIIGYIIYKFGSKGAARDEMVRIIAIAAGCLVMIAGYFLAETYVLGIVDPSFGLAAAVKELPFNAFQGAISALAGYAMATSLIRVKALKHTLE